MPISTASAPHYPWDDACDGWHLQSRQFFYVLDSELVLELDGVHYRLTANQGLEIASGLAHQAFNHGALDVRFLVVSQPPSHGDRIDA